MFYKFNGGMESLRVSSLCDIGVRVIRLSARGSVEVEKGRKNERMRKLAGVSFVLQPGIGGRRALH